VALPRRRGARSRCPGARRRLAPAVARWNPLPIGRCGAVAEGVRRSAAGAAHGDDAGEGRAPGSSSADARRARPRRRGGAPGEPRRPGRGATARGTGDDLAARIVRLAREATPAGTIGTVDAGEYQTCVTAAWHATAPREFLTSSATSGFALPAAIAAHLVHSERCVV